jgi:hypothetical protein
MRATSFFNAFRTAALAGLVGLTAFVAAPAQAGDVKIRLGHHVGFGVYIGDGYSRDHGDDFRWRKRCTVDRALFKARRIGVRHARIDYVTRSEIGVVGRSRGERVRITFARAPHCPVIG